MFYIENLGLEFLTDTEENAMALCSAVCAQGKPIVGYYDRAYLNHEFGWPQFIVRTGPTGEDNKVEVKGMDVHLSGVTHWTFGIRHATHSVENEDPLTRKVFAYKTDDGSGAAMIHLVNADVLPSFLPDDEITAQMVGFPVDIHYYEDEEKYAESQEGELDGKKLLLGNGTIFPVGLLSHKENKTSEEEDLMLIRGTVKSAQMGLVQFGEDKGWNFVDVVIGTQFGDLEIVHTLEQISEPERKIIKEGAIVNGLFMLSGDVAIKDYKEGYILDFKHNLALLRHTLQAGEAERLKVVLSDDAEYYSEWADETYIGKDAIVDRLNYVQDSNPERPFFAHYAIITDIVDGDEEVTHDVGERCIIIALENEDKLDSICFMECNDDNKITRIEVTRNPRYRFKIDEKKIYNTPFDDIEEEDGEVSDE